MESDDKLIAIIVVAIVLSFAACAITAMITDSRDRRQEQRRAEKEEAVGWHCWEDEWADTRAAQRYYLEHRDER